MIVPFGGKRPQIDNSCFIAPGAVIIGDVEIGPESSIWFGTVLRADINYIKIGRLTNLQDNMVVHVNHNDFPTVVGNYVTVGHGAILHGCTVENNCMIGMNAVILDGAVIGEGSIVAAGSVVKSSQRMPPGVLAAGNPAAIKRDLTDEERQTIKQSAIDYRKYAKGYQP